MIKQVNKYIKRVNFSKLFSPKEEEVAKMEKNNKEKNDKDMTLNEIEKAEGLVKNINNPKVKVIKKEKGLIERTETEKVVLTEDNRQVLTD